jgi:dolichol-phosphate mannosyltransferase
MYFAGLAFPGFTTVIVLELLIGGVLMISLGVIGTYIAQIYQEVKYRPRYVVAETLINNTDDKHSSAAASNRPEVTTVVSESPV